MCGKVSWFQMYKNNYKNLIRFHNICSKQVTGTPMLEHHQKDHRMQETFRKCYKNQTYPQSKFIRIIIANGDNIQCLGLSRLPIQFALHIMIILLLHLLQ
jgi:hypothetical protein